MGPRTFVVTGGAGFIGSHLVEELVRRDARVIVVDDLCTGDVTNLTEVRDHIAFERLDLRCDDMRPLLSAHPAETIFHLAASADVSRSVRDPRWDFETNLVSTLNVLEAMREASPEARLVFASSAAVYGNGSDAPLREDDPTTPISPYGISKLAAERYVSVYARLFGLRTASVRLFPVYGPRLRKQVIYDLIRKVHDNPEEISIYGDGGEIRDCNHVLNVVDALLLVAERAGLAGDVYNVAADEAVSILDLADLICSHAGWRPRYVFSGDVRPGDARKWSADISRIRMLGYRPRVALAAGLADTIAWFRQDIEASADSARAGREAHSV